MTAEHLAEIAAKIVRDADCVTKARTRDAILAALERVQREAVEACTATAQHYLTEARGDGSDECCVTLAADIVAAMRNHRRLTFHTFALGAIPGSATTVEVAPTQGRPISASSAPLPAMPEGAIPPDTDDGSW